MTQTRELTFENPGFYKRLKGMLGVDFYRLFHTPIYYIFLAIAAMIPAMVLSMGDYANMNMVPIFGGIMASIFIGHDYKSGYVKQLFTTHSLKSDYTMSKSIVGAFSMMCMCVTCLAGGAIFAFAIGNVSRVVLLKTYLV